ncbi:unnamed protein product [Mortierella alpina]
MNLPEVRSLVAIHICSFTGPRHSRHYLAVCARVCKDWFATFMPFLYQSLSLTTQSTSSSPAKRPLPSLETLLAYRHLVQELHLDLDSTYSLALQQPSVAVMQNLTVLEELFPEVAATVNSHITELQLHDASGEGNLSLVDWLELCPRLETVSVTKPRMPWYGSVSQFRPGLQLVKLNLDCGRLQDVELAEVLTRSVALRELALTDAYITRPVFEALSGHFGSLVVLNLLLVPTIEQSMMRRVLEGGSRLVALSLPGLDLASFYSAMSHDLPWACRGSLRELCILTIRMSLEGTVNDWFMRRLMDLKHLEEFFTMAIRSGDGTGRPLKPVDVAGDTPEAHVLAKLCAIRNWELSGRDLSEDPRWKLVRDTWPKLSSFSYNGSNGEYDE